MIVVHAYNILFVPNILKGHTNVVLSIGPKRTHANGV